jgi:invasion protein IalB/pimeloyl-ACP methyl ester carboxylesterase
MKMVKRLLLLALLLLAFLPVASPPAVADQSGASPKVQEEVWALPFPLPILAFVAKPVGDGPFPLVIMNHGISLDYQQRTMFPLVEYRAAALWFARRGYVVVSPVRYGASSLDDKDKGIYGTVFVHVGSCDNPNFRGPGLWIATLDEWVIDYMSKRKMVQPGKVVVVGQSGGGWGSIALASLNPPSVKAVITFEAGRGGRVDGKPNNNCAPDKLVAAVGEFGRTARVPMLWIYTENDSYFGPKLAKRMHDAFTEAGGNAKYIMLPAFGSDGHFMIDSPDAVPIWSPFVTQFLEAHSATGASPQQQASDHGDREQEPALKPPQLNLPQNIHYSKWEKLCFDSSDGTAICRMTSTGTNNLDQVIVRVDLIERAGGRARLQLFVPQGANLQQGVEVKVDQSSSTQIPFNYCLANICIAARGVDPALVAELENGQELELELTDLNSSSVSTKLPLNQFAAARKAAPAQTFNFGLDQE